MSDILKMNHIQAEPSVRDRKVRKVVAYLEVAIIEVQKAIADSYPELDSDERGCLADVWSLLRDNHSLFVRQIPPPVTPDTPKQRKSLLESQVMITNKWVHWYAPVDRT